MLIEFSVENYKCFATQQTLNMRPDPDIHALDENLIRTGLTQENGKELELLPTVAIYGANASGKSNLLTGLFRTSKLPILSDSALFESFFMNRKNSTYSLNQFYIFKDSNKPVSFKMQTKIESDNSDSRKKSGVFYSIDSEKTNIEHYVITDKQAYNSIQQTYSSNYHGFSYSRPYYFLNEILDQSLPNERGVFESRHDEPIPLMATLDEPERKAKLKQLLRKADFNIEDITAHKAQSGKNKTLYTLEFKIKGQEETLWYNDQSEGTKRFLLMMPTIVHVLETGAILLADELEQHLHPDLCKAIVELFNSRETNPHGSQLIFTTHNLELMDLNRMRPDQIYFINKDEETGASELYRASDYDMDWNNDEKWSNPAITIQLLYEMGRFSAHPKLWGGLA